MKYSNIKEAIFLERPNRFIAVVEVDGKEEKSHIKNTGRCKELLTEGTTVFLEDFHGRMGTRKMRYSLIGVIKEENKLMVNMDSQAPNKVVEEALLSGNLHLEGMSEITHVKRESKYGNSRFDFYVEDSSGKRGYIEVKGVTLETDGIVRFPDAPTERGVKHIGELIDVKRAGLEAYIIFVIQMEGMKHFEPNYETHQAFGDALVEAEKHGVKILAYDCLVNKDTLVLNKPLPVKLI